MKTMLKGAGAAIAVSLVMATGARADLTPTGVPCSLGDVYLQGFGQANACLGWYDGNNDGASQEADVMAAVGTWLTNPEGTTTDTDGWGTDGTLDLGNLYTDFVVALKAGNQFSLYYFAGAGSMVDFDIDGLGNGLSHWTLYGGDETTVPEPGTLFLLGTGLFGMAALRRRREDVT